MRVSTNDHLLALGVNTCTSLGLQHHVIRSDHQRYREEGRITMHQSQVHCTDLPCNLDGHQSSINHWTAGHNNIYNTRQGCFASHSLLQRIHRYFGDYNGLPCKSSVFNCLIQDSCSVVDQWQIPNACE